MAENAPTVCPICDGQGHVKKVRIFSLSIEGFLCDECEAFWLKKEEISPQGNMTLTTFLESKGLDYNSTQIKFLD